MRRLFLQDRGDRGGGPPQNGDGHQQQQQHRTHQPQASPQLGGGDNNQEQTDFSNLSNNRSPAASTSRSAQHPALYPSLTVQESEVQSALWDTSALSSTSAKAPAPATAARRQSSLKLKPAPAAADVSASTSVVVAEVVAAPTPGTTSTPFVEPNVSPKKNPPIMAAKTTPVLKPRSVTMSTTAAAAVKPPPPVSSTSSSSISAASALSAPLFGRPSKKSCSLEDDLPDAKRQQEQHSAFAASYSSHASKPSASFLLEDTDEEEDDDDNYNEQQQRLHHSQSAPRDRSNSYTSQPTIPVLRHYATSTGIRHSLTTAAPASAASAAASVSASSSASAASLSQEHSSTVPAASSASASLYPTLGFGGSMSGNGGVASLTGPSSASASASSRFQNNAHVASASVSVASAARLPPPASTPAYGNHSQNEFQAYSSNSHSSLESMGFDSKLPAKSCAAETTVSAFSCSTADNGNNNNSLSPCDMEVAKDYARTLRDVCSQGDHVDLEYLETLLVLCKDVHDQVQKSIEQAVTKEDVEVSFLEELFQLNENMMHAIEAGETTCNDFRKPTAMMSSVSVSSASLSHLSKHSGVATSSGSVGPASGNANPITTTPIAGVLDIHDLVDQQDIFSLICMLRAQQQERRLEAAFALMQFSRDADQIGGPEHLALRNEICSLGGMQSLLTLFRMRGTTNEVRIVVALAVAYLLPSFVDMSGLTPPSLGLKIMECLRVLSKAPKITPNGEVVTSEESFKASANGLFLFWINQLVPMLDSEVLENPGENYSQGDGAMTPLSHNVSVTGRSRNGRTAGGGVFDQRRESIELQELLEMAVTLIVYIAQPNDPGDRDAKNVVAEDLNLDTSRYTLVEQVCAVERARPIAVRQRILSILVNWIKSSDPEKIRPAASALRHLTSIKDKYMAGWIHSQIVNEGAVEGIVNLTSNFNRVGHDVQLSVAQVLSSLCVAPHTRAAVVEAKGIALLIQFICEHKDSPSQEGALFAGRALVQLAAGAITRSSVFDEEDFELGFGCQDQGGNVVESVIESGAIESFVDIALSSSGKLRSVAVEALRVFSEDTSPSRQTRGQLCRHEAAKALGVALKENVEKNGELLQSGSDLALAPPGSIKELHEALCALANILDPLPEGSPSPLNYHRQGSRTEDTLELLINGCKQTTDSGGLESLLFIASLPFVPPDEPVIQQFQRMSLLEETCRSLASMSLLLLTDSVASSGYSKWTDKILKALYKVSQHLETTESLGDIKDSVTEVQVNVLRAVGALAKSEPLKVRIVDRLLPYLLQANNVRDVTDISDAANQAFQSVGFSDDEVAVQVAGNNPQLLADWFCLERSCLIQAMARDEIRQIVQDIWGVPFRETDDANITRLIREVSDFSKSDDGSSGSPDLFDNFANDIETERTRDIMLRQYRDVYGERDSQPLSLLERVSGEVGQSDGNPSLLSHQIYPLNSSDTETAWILDHDRFLSKAENTHEEFPGNTLSTHVENLLSRIFPSLLIRNHVIPIHNFRPRASFNFRGLMMPQRRYFSFRREGQLLSRLCATEAAALDSTDVYWTLGFTNSSFAGEFSESLVQALYLCPMILGLSFSKTTAGNQISRDPERENKTEEQERGAVLASLAGSLPPWINSLTFDGLMNDRDLKSLVAILETMGKLSAGQETRSAQEEAGSLAGRRKASASTTCAQAQGRFCFFAIRRSLQIREQTWRSFFKLLGREDPTASVPIQMPLSSLKILDLSGNGLGDDLCATVLQLAHDKDSGCRIEHLDLSGNRILTGTRVQGVLYGYVEYHRYSQQAGRVKMKKKGWKSPLHTLYLADNGLHIGRAWLELVSLLKHNALELQVLDLSSNGLILMDDEVEFCDVLASTLMKNTCLRQLNLSGNKFSSSAIDHVLGDLSAASNDSSLAFLQLDGNSPALSNHQKSLLSAISSRSRKVLLQRFLKERLEETSDAEQYLRSDNLSPLHANEYSIPEEEESSIPSGKPIMPLSVTNSAANVDNTITILFSAPLVYWDDRKVESPFLKLDLGLERELMWQCLKEASRDIDLYFDSATPDRFLTAISKKCTCLHYSGHGHQHYLPFENKGGAHWFSVDDIKNLIANECGAAVRFVFVSACHSENVGMTFAEAGVPHVVCCKQESELKDAAALAFTRQFYLSLAVGNTVKESFDQGCKAVRATPNLRDAEKEMMKFRLLPEDKNHDVPIFDAKPVAEWPRALSENRTKSHRRGSTLGRSLRKNSGGTSTSELSVRNMIQEDPSPSPTQYFLGREVDMFHVLSQILEKRLVSVVGEAGIGRSSLVCALCHYINERASTMIEINRIYFVKAIKDRRQNRSLALVRRLMQKLFEADKLHDPPDQNADIETLIDIVCKTLKNEKALIVFDRLDLLEDSDETNEFPVVLSSLLRETRNVKVLLTNRKPLLIPSIGEKAIELGPLSFGNTVRLFANLCPYLHTPKDRRKLFEKLVPDSSQEHLMSTDPGMTASTYKLFSVIGDGVPSRIEKAAYDITKEDFLSLMNGSVLDRQEEPTEAQKIH